MLDLPFPLHPVFVHFTVALSFTSIGAYILAYFVPQDKLKKDLSISAMWMLFFCFIASLFTIVFGFLQYNSVKHDMLVHMPMTNHRDWALVTTVTLFICCILALNGYLNNKTHQISLTFGILILGGLVGTTAYKGGELVYHYGLAVKSTPELREVMQKNQNEQKHENIFEMKQ